MAVTLIDRTVKVAKETDEVLALVVEVVKTVREGGDYATLVDDLVRAIDGVGNVPTEAKEALVPVLRAVSNRSVDIAEALLTPKLQPLAGK